ncbi:VCBS repeat-containing protein [Flagellimonas sp.]|uniref:VCBS repeat-containing protein n=1 Tax=Flagellimonas sp. TaxID=2058762 RepID=UPI003B52E877
MLRHSSTFRSVLWLFLIAIIGCTSTESPKEANTVLFQKLDSDFTGIDFTNKITERFEYFENFSYAYNGGGVAIGDINNDGLQDVFFSGNEVEDRLYLNKGGLRFEDITQKANIKPHKGWSNGVSMVDINSDGFLDIYVCRGGWQDTDENRGNLLYINQGDGSFKEQASNFGVADIGYSTQAVFFDFDRDSDLDLYVVNRPNQFMLPIAEVLKNKQQPSDYNRDKLYRNDGGKYVEIGREVGLAHNFGYGLGVVASDVNGDGFTDIYVANDFDEDDYLYINRGGKYLEEQIKQSTKHISLYSMGVDIMDINNDGLEDIFVTEMLPADHKRAKQSMPSMDVEGFNQLLDLGFHHQYMHNMLHLNQGNTMFSEVGKLSGIDKTDWSWAGLASDFDNDGNKDLLVTNGYKRDIFDKDIEKRLTKFFEQNRPKFQSAEELIAQKSEEIINLYKPIKEVNYLYKNLGELNFKNVSGDWGFQEKSFSNGAAVADLDNDGDLDLVINNLDDEAFVFKNTSSDSNTGNYLKIKLIGPQNNATGLGAKITLKIGKELQYQEFKTVRGYLSSHEPIVHFGLGKNRLIDSLTVRWPDDKEQTLEYVSHNQAITLNYQNAGDTSKQKKTESLKLFETSGPHFGLDFEHRENIYNDFAKEVLLPHRYSQLGPALATTDINNDGLDDVYVGGAMGQEGQMFVQQKNGEFLSIDGPWKGNKESEEVSAIFFDLNNDGLEDLFVVNGGNEALNGTETLKDRLYLNQGDGKFTDSTELIPDIAFSGGRATPCDYDGDGDLDLFVAGRLVPQKYPLPASSYLYENKNGKLVDVTDNKAVGLMDLGLVTDAVWMDYDNDQDKDLLVVGEWMPLTLFKNEQGFFKKSNPEQLGFENTEGWWYSVEVADFNKDGHMDIIAGNLGLNYKYRASIESPFMVFGSDFDKNGKNDIILGFEADDKVYPVRGKECSSQQMPYLKHKFKTYKDFSGATVLDMVGKKSLEESVQLKASTFATTYFQNKGDGTYISTKLPNLAQFSSVNDIQVDDFDLDGNLDVILAGNLYTSEVETPRNDASFGTFLKGNGQGDFYPLYPHQSGLYMDGDVKDMASITIKGEQYVVVANNDSSLRLIKLNMGVR